MSLLLAGTMLVTPITASAFTGGSIFLIRIISIKLTLIRIVLPVQVFSTVLMFRITTAILIGR